MRSVSRLLAFALVVSGTVASIGCGGGGGGSGGASEADLCQGITCGGQGTCVVSDDVAACQCQGGWIPDGQSCKPSGIASCTIAVAEKTGLRPVACQDYTGSGWTVSGATGACAGWKDSSFSQQPCSSTGATGLLGRCRIRAGEPDERIDTYYLVPGSLPDESAEAQAKVCVADGGTWLGR